MINQLDLKKRQHHLIPRKANSCENGGKEQHGNKVKGETRIKKDDLTRGKAVFPMRRASGKIERHQSKNRERQSGREMYDRIKKKKKKKKKKKTGGMPSFVCPNLAEPQKTQRKEKNGPTRKESGRSKKGEDLDIRFPELRKRGVSKTASRQFYLF